VGGLGNLGMAGMDDEWFYPKNPIPDIRLFEAVRGNSVPTKT